MEILKVHLKEHYPFLDNGLADPVLDIMLQDFYTSINATERPAIVVLPGGGYANLAPHEAWSLALEYMSLGCNGFVLYYSTNAQYLQNTYPQQLLEVACALDYICNRKDEFCIDPNKIILTGSSAGGHLAASYCTLRNRPEVTRHIDPQPIAAAILNYPVISATEQYHAGSVDRLLGKQNAPEAERALVSCEKFVDPEITPPTFIWAAVNDQCVPVSNSLRYAQALADANIPFELHIYPDGKHGQSNFAPFTCKYPNRTAVNHTGQWMPAAKNWIKQLFALY